MPEKPTQSLARVRADIRRDRATIERAQARLVENVRRAVELGASAPDLAEDTGYTVSRVGQLVGGVRKVRAAAGTSAPKRRPTRRDEPEGPQGVTADCDPTCPPAQPQSDELPERYRPGAVGRVRQLVHAEALVSDRWDKPRDERPTVFVDVTTGEWWSPAGETGRMPWRAASAAELLAGLPGHVVRVYFVGPHRPGVTPERVRVHGREADAARSWFLEPVPEGWAAAGHYLVDDAALVGRWIADTGREVEVQRASVWFGDGAYDARSAAYAWHVLRGEIAEQFPGGVLMSTPATTGRDLWRRIIPKGKGFPVLSAEMRELIQSTSGQGRRELVAHEPASLMLVTQYDMRVAYAAMTWGMPVGGPHMITGKMWDALADDEQAMILRRRGRWLVRATVPGGWEHVGILPTPRSDGTWAWPSTPGASFTSWASASEVSLAREHGWRVDVLEGFHFDEGKPLNTWKDKIMAVHDRDPATRAAPPHISQLVKAAARMLVLSSIGAFASRSHAVTHTVPMNSDAPLPEHAPIRPVGDMWVWEEPGTRSPWMERVSHPEWSAEVWGRCRARLLSGPAVGGVRTGALHVKPGTVIGMRTDGLTLAGDPGWPDDGAVGRFRLTGRLVGDIAWPQSDAELSGLKRAAEAIHEAGGNP